jgi:hypothetical protein
MIVRDAGDSWQVVLQTDHADLAAAFARGWADRGTRHDAVVIAAERHDDGWAVWEQAPRIDPVTGKPVNFLDVDVPAHLAFYRACIAAVSEQDAYAGLLVSMHGAGIYRQRYGTDPVLGLSRAAEVQELVDAFVDEQESSHADWAAAAGVSDEERWADYHRLQLYDRFALYFCLRDVEAGEQGEILDYRFEPLGPWHVRLDPYPLDESPARFSLLRRLVPKRDGLADLLTLEPERVEITVER